MTTPTQRRKAEQLLETTFVDVHTNRIWKVTDIDGKILRLATDKTHALYLACEIEGKVNQLLAIR
jgi:hypothetical protein